MIKLSALKGFFKGNIKGENTDLHILENSVGTQVGICNYGARITHFVINEKIDVVLGFDTLNGYKNAAERYFGVTVGPYANRIANGEFTLDGKRYALEQNNGTNNLHGGSTGFHDKVWAFEEKNVKNVSLKTQTFDGEGGFPGELDVKVVFCLTDENELLIEYFAKSKSDTIINLTNHAYFNLNGIGSIEKHEVYINANKFVEINKDCIPLNIKDVKNTPFDFTNFKRISKDISQADYQLEVGNGYDHSFELVRENDKDCVHAATVIGDSTKLKLEVFTTEPAVQFYTGNFLSGDKGKNDMIYGKRTGFCLESQHHPDSPNQKDFKSTILRKGEQYYSKTIYKITA